MVAFARVVGVVEHTANLGAHSEGLEVGAGHGLDMNHLRLLAVVDEAVNIVDHAEDGRGV